LPLAVVAGGHQVLEAGGKADELVKGLHQINAKAERSPTYEILEAPEARHNQVEQTQVRWV
jgi:hypothetical protein